MPLSPGHFFKGKRSFHAFDKAYKLLSINHLVENRIKESLTYSSPEKS